MVLQKMVPGGDDHMRVLTAFSDENGKVRAMCLGHTMVEEHTPPRLGNHAAIVSEDTASLPAGGEHPQDAGGLPLHRFFQL